jgi:nucleoside-triphosphatase THEP1
VPRDCPSRGICGGRLIMGYGMAEHPNIVLWTGPQHSGKTTAATELVRQARAAGHSVAGILAPSVWLDGWLSGFEVIDIASGQRMRLATRGVAGAQRAGQFAFCAEGLILGQTVLSSNAAMTADLTVVDEFGPLEFSGNGWRRQTDDLARRASGLLLFVVRKSLVGQVCGLYGVPDENVVDATHHEAAINTVLRMMARR